MEFNKETFEKALKVNKIVRYQQHFEAVVKSYLEAENQALRIHDVVGRSEQLKAKTVPAFDNWLLKFESKDRYGETMWLTRTGFKTKESMMKMYEDYITLYSYE